MTVADETRKRSELKWWLGVCCALLGMCAAWLPAGAQVTNFVLASAPRVVAGPWSVAVADLNGDGKLDLVSASPLGDPSQESTLTVLTNNGSNVFGVNAVLRLGINGAQGVTVADVNGDGKLDLVTADIRGTLTVLTNNGSGVFGANATLNVANRPDSVTVADVNGNGQPDLISINDGFTPAIAPETLTIFTNNGSGVFGSNATLNVTATSSNTLPINVVAADVNADGKPDLICPSPSAGAVEIWTNNGTGIFGSNATVNVGNTPDWVAVADVNGDGKPDIVCANADNYLTVLTNNGNGVFGSNATLSVTYPVFVAVGDVNEDGRPDLICASPGVGSPIGLPLPGDNTLTIFTNDGSGGFALDGKLAVGGAPFNVAVADINDDGQMDLICPSANGTTTNLDIFTNTIVPGHTGFRLMASPGVGTAPASVAVADVNLDGQTDLISANALTNTLTLLTNNGSGGFGSNATLDVGSGPYCVVSADVNGDGQPDLISANFLANTLTILTNNGHGNFGSNATLNVNVGDHPDGMVTADVNGNGRPDLLCLNYGSASVEVWTNNGGGEFGSNTTVDIYPSSQPRKIVVGDVNGDGQPDFIIANSQLPGGLPPPPTVGGLTVFTNNGSGGFEFSQGMLPVSLSVAVADVNGDGKPDLVSADYASDNLLRVWTNNGSGWFGSNATLRAEGPVLSVTLADANRDGKPDVIAAGYDYTVPGSPGYLTIFTNNGSGGFGSNLTVHLGDGSLPHPVTAADLNGDGRLDLITANHADNTLSVLFNVPYLNMGIQTNGANLVWPYPSSGYVLQQNTDLGAPDWVNVTNSVNFIGGQNQVTLPPPARNDFFRLMHP